MAKAYYNDTDQYAAQWLRNLIEAGHIAPGDVDTRSIVDVRPDDLKGYTQVHFFAGIGGWSLAARLAGWPDTRRLWTGSCPCQPFSAAGKRKGTADERHLWPEMRRLVGACRPAVVAGEQVASKDGRVWLSGVRVDLEDMAYDVWAADYCSADVSAPHIRQRIWWLAHSDLSSGGQGREDVRRSGQGSAALPRARLGGGVGVGGLADDDDYARCGVFAERDGEPPAGSDLQVRPDADGRGGIDATGQPGRLADSDGWQPRHGGLQPGGQHGQQPQDGGVGRLGDTGSPRTGRDARAVSGPEEEGHSQGRQDGRGGLGAVDTSAVGRLGDTHHQGPQGWLDGPREGWRADQRPARPAGQSGFWDNYDIVHCTDGKARRFEPGSFPLAHGVSNRVGRLRAYGNAINPWLAAEILKAYLDGPGV